MAEEEKEARMEDEENDDRNGEEEGGDDGEQSSSSSSSSSNSEEDDDSDDDEEGGGGGGQYGGVAAAAPPLDRRRSSAQEGAIRITVIGELAGEGELKRRASQSPAIPPTSSSSSTFSSSQPFRLPPLTKALSVPDPPHSSSSPVTSSTSSPSAPPAASSAPPSSKEGRRVMSIIEQVPVEPSSSSSPPTLPLPPSSSTPSLPHHLSASATVSPPFPAPPLVSSYPMTSPQSTAAPTPSPMTSAASASPPLPPSSQAARPSASVSSSDQSPGVCRVLHSVDALLSSRYDSNYDRPDQPVWISVENASSSSIERIGQHFDLHPLTIEDCQSKHTREKLEIFQHYLFLVFHALQQTGRKRRRRRSRKNKGHKGNKGKSRGQHGDGQADEGKQAQGSSAGDGTMAGDDDDDDDSELEDSSSSSSSSMRTTSIKLIVFPHLILSFTSGLRFPTLLAVRHRLRQVYDNRLESTAWIIHAMLDSIVDALLPVVDGTVVEVDALEDLIYVLSGSEHRDLLKRMGLTRRRLSFLRQRLWSKRDILMSLIGKDWQLFLAGVQIPYLRDVYDHVITMLHKIEAASDLLSSLQNTYLANVSIDVAEQSKQSNEIMKNLSAVATIVLPLSLIAGIMGMNVQVPWQHDSNNDLATLAPFITICGGMVVVTILMIVYFRWNRLL